MKMKKLLSAALAAAMVLSLAACGKKDQPAAGSQSGGNSEPSVHRRGTGNAASVEHGDRSLYCLAVRRNSAGAWSICGNGYTFEKTFIG